MTPVVKSLSMLMTHLLNPVLMINLVKLDDVKLAGDLKKKWPITRAINLVLILTPPKWKSFPLIVLNANLQASDSFRLLELTFSTDMKWRDYIVSVAKSATRKFGSLWRVRQFFSTEPILHINKFTIY